MYHCTNPVLITMFISLSITRIYYITSTFYIRIPNHNKNNVLIKTLFLFNYLFYFIRKKHFIRIKMKYL